MDYVSFSLKADSTTTAFSYRGDLGRNFKMAILYFKSVENRDNIIYFYTGNPNLSTYTYWLSVVCRLFLLQFLSCRPNWTVPETRVTPGALNYKAGIRESIFTSHSGISRFHIYTLFPWSVNTIEKPSWQLLAEHSKQQLLSACAHRKENTGLK